MSAKILLYDLETTPVLGYTWGVYQQDVLEVVEDWYILCFAYKWYGEKGKAKIKSVKDYPSSAKKDGGYCDKLLCKDLYKLMNEADIVVGHNSGAFDDKKSKARSRFPLSHGG